MSEWLALVVREAREWARVIRVMGPLGFRWYRACHRLGYTYEQTEERRKRFFAHAYEQGSDEVGVSAVIASMRLDVEAARKRQRGTSR